MLLWYIACPLQSSFYIIFMSKPLKDQDEWCLITLIQQKYLLSGMKYVYDKAIAGMYSSRGKRKRFVSWSLVSLHIVMFSKGPMPRLYFQTVLSGTGPADRNIIFLVFSDFKPCLTVCYNCILAQSFYYLQYISPSFLITLLFSGPWKITMRSHTILLNVLMLTVPTPNYRYFYICF